MSVTLYSSTFAPFLRGMRILHAILLKAETHAASTKTPLSYYLSARLYPDMQGLPYQIQRVSDTAKGFLTRALDHEPVPMPDTETTFEELKQRLEKTIALFEKVKEEDVAAVAGDKEVVLPRGGGVNWETNLRDFVSMYSVPNFYFHLSVAYGILRSCGVPVGKGDYLGANSM